VDPENVDPAFLIGQSELDFSVQTSRTEESRIEGVGPIRGHQDFDVAAGIEAVQLKKKHPFLIYHFKIGFNIVPQIKVKN
jgi:hypothetical protein